MTKFETLDQILHKNNGFIKTSEAVKGQVSKVYFAVYVKERGLERAAHGLYMSRAVEGDDLYVIQARYPKAVFSHETAGYLMNPGKRKPVHISVTLKAGSNAMGLSSQGIKVYKVKDERFETGIVQVISPAGHGIRTYNTERTLCDLIRSRRRIEIHYLQAAMHEYVRMKEKNIPLLMQYARMFSVEKKLHQYFEMIL